MEVDAGRVGLEVHQDGRCGVEGRGFGRDLLAEEALGEAVAAEGGVGAGVEGEGGGEGFAVEAEVDEVFFHGFGMDAEAEVDPGGAADLAEGVFVEGVGLDGFVAEAWRVADHAVRSGDDGPLVPGVRHGGGEGVGGGPVGPGAVAAVVVPGFGEQHAEVGEAGVGQAHGEAQACEACADDGDVVVGGGGGGGGRGHGGARWWNAKAHSTLRPGWR